MSRISRPWPQEHDVYIELIRRDESPWGYISSVHGSHPMRRMETVRVGSLSEMRGIVRVGFDIANQNALAQELAYAILPSGPKPNADIVLDAPQDGIITIAATTDVPLDSFGSGGVSNAIRALLWRKIDVIEAIIWYGIYANNGFVLSPPSPISSFRELFAFGRLFLMRVTPDLFFHALMTPRTYGAMLLDNAAGVNQDSSYTEHQIAAGIITPIPVAINYTTGIGSYPTYEHVAIYHESLPRVCKRYVYEVEHVNMVRDGLDERNLMRVTCERYLAPIFPLDFYWDGRHVAPIAVISALDAINAISTKYGSGTMDNLDYFASAT